MDVRFRNLFDRYASIITNNSETTADVEMLCKYLSYFASGKWWKEVPEILTKIHFQSTGKVTDNSIVTEGLFTLSNLIVLFNDQVIRRELLKGEPQDAISDTEESIKLFLTVLENVEVLIEITSKKILGNAKKFIIIFIIQAVK